MLCFSLGVYGIALAWSLSLWIMSGVIWLRTPTGGVRLGNPIRFVLAAASTGVLLFAVPWHTLIPSPWLRPVLALLSAVSWYGMLVWPALKQIQSTLSTTIDSHTDRESHHGEI